MLITPVPWVRPTDFTAGIRVQIARSRQAHPWRNHLAIIRRQPRSITHIGADHRKITGHGLTQHIRRTFSQRSETNKSSALYAAHISKWAPGKILCPQCPTPPPGAHLLDSLRRARTNAHHGTRLSQQQRSGGAKQTSMVFKGTKRPTIPIRYTSCGMPQASRVRNPAAESGKNCSGSRHLERIRCGQGNPATRRIADHVENYK